MSFFSNFSSDHCPGPITGNPLNGLCEKVCIQAEKIFDAGIIQTRLENYTLVLTDLTPECPTYPLTFVSARSITGTGTVSDLSVERQPDSCCARVQARVTIPVEVVYTDACGREGKALSTITLNDAELTKRFSTSIPLFGFAATCILEAFTDDLPANAMQALFFEERSGIVVSSLTKSILTSLDTHK